MAVILSSELVERPRHLKSLEVIRHENQSTPDRVGSALRGQLGSDRELVDRHGVAVQVPEVELRPSVVAGEHLIVVEDDRVHLVGVVELGALMLVNDQR